MFVSTGIPLLEIEAEQIQDSTASSIVEEDFTTRGECEKHFLCEDGSVLTAAMPTYQNKDSLFKAEQIAFTHSDRPLLGTDYIVGDVSAQRRYVK